MPETETELIDELAFGCRVLGYEGQGDAICGHVSTRAPGRDALYMKSGGLGLEEVQPEDIVLLDFDGNIVHGDRPVHVEWPIHAEILRSRPDIACVVHTHPLHAIAFGATGEPLRPVSHEGARFSPPDLPRFSETTGLIDSPALGRALAATLGDRNALLLLNHGVVTVAEDIARACLLAVALESACRVQLLAMSSGRAYRWTPEGEILPKRARLNAPVAFRANWAYYRRKLGHPLAARPIETG